MMSDRTNRLLSITLEWSRTALCLLLATQYGLANVVGAEEEQQRGLLFADAAPLALQLTLDFDAICLDPTVSDCVDTPATLSYRAEDGTEHKFDILLRTRGRGSERTSACAFPSFFIRFPPEQTHGTLFAGESSVPFTTHCFHHSKLYQAYSILEYLAYRLYNLVTENSLKVRLARVSYRRAGSKRTFTRYGFFTEHFEGMAERIGAEIWETEQLDPRRTDAVELAMLSVFQYMIGNLDWSVIRPHNIVLFRKSGGAILPVAFDFDYSGLVDTEYAVPPDYLRIRTVRTRRYRGFCRPDTDWDAVFNGFLAQREGALRLIGGLPELSRARRIRARSYLTSFFRILESERERQKSIVTACRPMPPPE